MADLGSKVLLERESLMKGFSLAECDIHIDFAALDQNFVEVDVEKVKGDSRPRIRALNAQQKKALAELLRGLPPESRIREMTGPLFRLIGSLPPVTDSDIRGHVQRVLETMQLEEMDDCTSRPHAFAERIREKIRALMTGFAKEGFQRGLRRNRIVLQPSFRLPPSIFPAETANPYANRLYEEENRINGLEGDLIRLVSNLPNLVFWRGSGERGHGFRINGAINHCPDFILLLKSGAVVMVEAKGTIATTPSPPKNLILAAHGPAGSGPDFSM
ncbi:hypothetical protein [Azospirillum soli]|uniref:hypothetical protein n=1 Tax=Azospirillum soli TaxID=1304799 RepID=UPI001AE7A0D0|nr:hypothetical protein [Azospirillum soli]MBP2316919.1 hypothetical protein [Azospirillum soli]